MSAEEEEYEEEDEQQGARESGDGSQLTSPSLAYLAMLPMLAAYEWAQSALVGAPRNAGELVLSLPLSPLADGVAAVRRVLLVILALLALATVRRMGARVRAGTARIALEGAGFALILGPLLVLGMTLCGRWVEPLDVSWDPTGGEPPELVRAALLFGGSAWEELCFRLGVYSFLYWLTLRFTTGVGGGARAGRVLADVVGLLGSALVFALVHFAPFSDWLGTGGRPLEAPLFTWLLLAGCMLGLLFRLRGPGIAAWAHGLFNVALWIGIDPEVLL